MNPASLVAYLVLFGAVGFVFVFSGLLVGRFLRARVPTPQKQEIYECGEPPIGSGYLQFDLRFYVVALVFIIFEVELAFFFPWAVVFGKTAQLLDPRLPGPAAVGRLHELGVPPSAAPAMVEDAAAGANQIRAGARQLALAAMIDLAVFFAILLVGFAYVWHRGDLDWVRAIGRQTPATGGTGLPVLLDRTGKPVPPVAGASLERGDA